MHVIESRWIRDQLARQPDKAVFPLLDVGSSTLEYRTRVQPWIEQNVFAPLRARGGRIYHADMKEAAGVDLVGDLLDAQFQDRLRTLGVRSILLCNVLHHLPARHDLLRSVTSILPAGGLVLASGPYRYPRHFDPIDTLYRPTPEEVASELPGTRMLAGAVLDSGNWHSWTPGERGGRSLARFLARLCVPVYRPREWLRMLPHVPYIVRHMKAYAVLLEKTG